jgi:O-antigen/teichoic acid export membrane protein
METGPIMDKSDAAPAGWPPTPAEPVRPARGRLARRAATIAGHELTRGIIGTMSIKLIGAALAFLMFSLAARAMGETEFGRFVTWFSAASIAATVSVFGQEMLILRSWSEYVTSGRFSLAHGALKFGLSVAGGLSLLVGFVIVAAEILAGDTYLAAAVGLFIVVSTVLMFSTHVTRALVGIWQADGFRELTWRIVTIACLAVVIFRGETTNGAFFFTAAVAGLLIALAYQVVCIRRAMPAAVIEATPAYDLKGWLPRSARLWAAAVIEAVSQYFEVVLIAFLLDPVAAGAYFVASRLSNAFAMAADGLYSFGTRRLPPLYYARDVVQLDQTLRFMAGVMGLAVAAGLTIVFFGSDILLGLFGSAYVEERGLLILLCIGTATFAAAGPAGAVLMLTGHEGRYTLIVTTGVALRMVGLLIFAPIFGILGAAAVTATVFVVLAVVLVAECRRLTGLDTSVMIFLRRPPTPETAP